MTALRADISAVLRNARPAPLAADDPAPSAARVAGPGQRRRQKNQRNHPAPAQGPEEDRSPSGKSLRLVPEMPSAAVQDPAEALAVAPASVVPTGAASRDATFASLGVPAFLVAALEETGISKPFPIQAATLPDAMAGRDILGRAQTGSGKTLGFSLPLVARLEGGVTAPRQPRGLVLVPTRELATQVQEVLAPLAESMGLTVATIFGGVSYKPQINAMNRRTDIVVACPGRLADLIGQGHCDLRDVQITVIDEADHMADLGFLPTVRRLLDDTPADSQRLLFSATLDGAVDVLAKRFMNEPVLHSVDDVSSPAAIEHHVFTISYEHRLGVVTDLVSGDNRSLVFTRTKHGAQRLAKQLSDAGIPAVDLHGNLSQAARARNLGKFSAGHVRVLVATDVAARGIHVNGVDLVIHADPPAEHKAYVHRSGRTARGGADGTVVTIQTKSQARDVSRMMRAIGVAPQAAAASPGAAVLRAIAGPVAPPPAIPAPPADDRTQPGQRRRPRRRPQQRYSRPSPSGDQRGQASARRGGTGRDWGQAREPEGGGRWTERSDRGARKRSEGRARPGEAPRNAQAAHSPRTTGR